MARSYSDPTAAAVAVRMGAGYLALWRCGVLYGVWARGDA